MAQQTFKKYCKSSLDWKTLALKFRPFLQKFLTFLGEQYPKRIKQIIHTSRARTNKILILRTIKMSLEEVGYSALMRTY